MGKADEEERRGAGDPSSSGSAAGNAGRCRCSRCGRVVQLRCVAALVLGVAVLLSAVFWLPPFFGRRGHPSGLDLDADIVASFRLHRTVAELNENISKLEFDIFEEIGVPNSSVVVSSLEPLARSNWTTVVFGVWPYPKDSTLSSTLISILKSSFMSLVAKQSTLHLTTSLFGNSSFFEVLKFPGGITIIPSQSAFLLQKPHAFFNFTLNFPVYKVEEKINELKDQMKLGLFLNSYENLYVKLTNLNGSTVAPPTIVQTSIVLEVGNHQPSLPRLKQLAQTISNSSSGNLGLNHTLFGKVKQIHLSSYLQHSLNTGGSTGSPSPAPEPLHNFHHHHHHRHHHHGSRDDKYLAPAPQPSYQTPAPAPAPAPTGSQFRRSSKPKKNDFHSPAAAPAATQRHSAAHVASPPPSVAPVSVPQSPYIPNVHEKPPAPAPPLLSSSPLPSVYFAHGQPPGESATRTMPPAGMPSSPEHYSSSASGPHLVRYWVTASFLYLLMNSL